MENDVNKDEKGLPVVDEIDVAKPEESLESEVVKINLLSIQEKIIDYLKSDAFTDLSEKILGIVKIYKSANSRLETTRLIITSLFLLCLAGVVGLLGYLKVIDSTSTGTIIGGIVGFAAGLIKRRES